MKISINKRKLSNKEINLLNKEIKKFSNPVFLTVKHWRELNTAYIVEIGVDLVGTCSITKLDSWFKLGPFIVLEKFQKKGIGKMLLKKIVQDNKKNNLFIGSRNPAVWTIVKGLGFIEESNFWHLTNDIKFYLLRNLLWSIDLKFIKELFRKRSVNQGKYRFFVKKSSLQIF